MQRVALFLQHPRNLFISAGVVSGGVICIKSAPHVFPGLVFRPYYQAYKHDKAYELVPSQKSEFLQVCEDLGVKPKGYEVFVSSVFDIAWRGLPWLAGGVKFGFPETLRDKPDVSADRFPDPIKSGMDSEEGRKLQKALCLSQNARKFALAKEIALIDKNFPLYSIALAPCAITANFGLVALTQITNVVRQPNFFLLTLTCIPFYCAYQFLLSSIKERTDVKLDAQIARLGSEYVDGGVEYYEKRLEKNIALRKLLDTKGEKLYTYYGNERPAGILGLRSYGAPLTQKLTAMQNAKMGTKS